MDRWTRLTPGKVMVPCQARGGDSIGSMVAASEDAVSKIS
jgi:hypothetical protein